MSHSTKEVYDQIASNFSASRSYIWPDLREFLNQVNPNTTILDLGCGNGRLLLGLPKNIDYLGIDQSPKLLEKAKEFHPKADFYVQDITNPKTWQKLGQFDHIFCIAVLHHLGSKTLHQELIKNILKHLKPNGKFLITSWNLWQKKYLKYHLDPKTKLKNPYHVFVPFQGVPRFHFAVTEKYLKKLTSQISSEIKIQNTKKNYLIHNF